MGKSLFGWVPEEWVEEQRLRNLVCAVCGDGEERRNDYILLCDGEGCGKGYHMQCLRPRLQRQPARNRDWFCPECRDGHAKEPGRAKEFGGRPTDEPTAYELQRLNNIAQNQKMLESLGLA